MNRTLLSVLSGISSLGILRSFESKLLGLFRQIYANLWQNFGAISSVVERLLHTQEVAGSNPASRTICVAANSSSPDMFAVPRRAECIDKLTILGKILVVQKRRLTPTHLSR